MERKIFKRIKILITLLGFTFLNAQEIMLSGSVKDSLSPLPNANILAKPVSDNEQMTFAFSKNDGSYSLKLQKNATYEISISYLGYTSENFTINTTNDDIQKNFTLKPITNELEEVVINYKIPLIVKQDTLIYNVESFADGGERKLRDLLKNLPGVEVDREGNVTVQGKKVSRVLVENKTFFTGNSKLAVNNIPSDAVNKVEILDNYSEIPFLKGLEDSDEMAMNIKLKKDKKNFVFGDVEAGYGNDQHYIIHPNIFYYSPKTNVNFIGDFNNVGIKSFTFRDYIDFEGGVSKLLENTGSYTNMYNDDFSRYLTNNDFKANINRFGAFNMRQSINSKTDANAYIIAVNTDTETETGRLNEYVSTSPFIEERRNTGFTGNKFILGKITIDYEPAFDEDLALNTSFRITENQNNNIITTLNPFQDNEIRTLANATGLNFKQDVAYSRQFDEKHTGTLESAFNYIKDKPRVNWITNQPILQGLITLQDDAFYNVLQNKESESLSFNTTVKDYWVLNNFNHIYTSVGANLLLNKLYSEDLQLLSDGEENNFSSAGFGNDFTYNFTDVFAGLEYKFQAGKFIFKPALFYHFYNWQTRQLIEKKNNFKTLLLPQFSIKADLKSSEKINFDYSLNARFPSINQLVNNFMLQNFNSVYRGNENLKNTLYHSAILSYYKFSLYNNFLVNARISYNRRVKNVKPATELIGIDQFSTMTILNNPENNFKADFGISKKINTLKYNFKTGFNYNDFYQIVNNNTQKNISKQTSLTATIITYFNKKWPDFEFGYTKEFNNYKTQVTTSNFENDELFAEMEYVFSRDFVLKADYRRTDYKNKSANIETVFDTANASLFYQKEDSPWGFEINISNIFDVRYKQQNSFSDFLISDQRIFILPRIVMFKILYKL